MIRRLSASAASKLKSESSWKHICFVTVTVSIYLLPVFKISHVADLSQSPVLYYFSFPVDEVILFEFYPSWAVALKFEPKLNQCWTPFCEPYRSAKKGVICSTIVVTNSTILTEIGHVACVYTSCPFHVQLGWACRPLRMFSSHSKSRTRTFI